MRRQKSIAICQDPMNCPHYNWLVWILSGGYIATALGGLLLCREETNSHSTTIYLRMIHDDGMPDVREREVPKSTKRASIIDTDTPPH